MFARLAEEGFLRRASGDTLESAAVRVTWNLMKSAFFLLVYPVRLAVREWRRQRRLDRVNRYIRGDDS